MNFKSTRLNILKNIDSEFNKRFILFSKLFILFIKVLVIKFYELKIYKEIIINIFNKIYY